ncbi:ADAM 17-like protease [Aplysia californica]|uniref:ADAM 17-like protease n=1 Tax=Aplysia californica TaxID=6500 RepID=A0ABM0JIE7_APLCA|nr:ADAM 17-like protease [Aplysia californica]
MNVNHGPLHVVLLWTIWLFETGEGSIHSRLRHFEVLTPSDFRVRTKRDAVSGQVDYKILRFKAFGMRFHLVLTPGWSVVDSEELECSLVGADGRSEKFTVDTDRLYSGSVSGKPDTSVDAFHVNGMWTADIQDTVEHYTIEPIRRHETHSTSQNMVIYRSADLILGNVSEAVSNLLHKSCKTYDARKFRHLFQNESYNHVKESRGNVNKEPASGNDKGPYYAKDVRFHRLSRSVTPFHNICDIFAIMDTYTFDRLGQRDPQWSAHLLLFWHHKVNKIFTSTIFGPFRNIGMRVRRLVLLTQYTSGKSTWDEYNTDEMNASADELIGSMSKNNEFSSYCLAHLTTQRTMRDYVLGAAVNGIQTTYPPGGPCASSGQRALNVGFSTLGFENSIIADKMYIVVMAHELGHNWGSPHDPPEDPVCSPSEKKGGKYIMWARSNAAKSANNQKFSPCSIEKITALLKTKAHECFLPASASIGLCGDGIVSQGEECDEGFLLFTNTTIDCCTKRCTLRAGAVCSPSSSPCCSDDCHVAPKTQECKNLDAHVCRETSYCTGTDHSTCPKPRAREDDTPCNDHGTCWNGECLSFCENRGRTLKPPKQLVSCTCDSNREEMCSMCCMDILTNECRPTETPYTDGMPCTFGTCRGGVCRSSEYRTRKSPYVTGFTKNIALWLSILTFPIYIIALVCTQFVEI